MKNCMRNILLFTAAALGLAACTDRLETPAPSVAGVSFSLFDEGYVSSPVTKTVFSASDIETRKTSVTLAAYRAGTLYKSGYFTSNLSAMHLELIDGETYNIYAFVNMGNIASSLPSSESVLSSVSYSIPAWQTVNNTGLPMTGCLSSFTVGSSNASGTVPVTRRFARVTAYLSCTWPGANITGAVVGNMNGRIPLVGAAAMSGSGDALSWSDSDTGSGSSATMVFYVPENMQGTVSGITASHDKSHEFNATVAANQSKLTYLEVTVNGLSSSSAMYGGNVTYRSYLGANATTNFDIAGNTAYTWTITYSEDGLAQDTWKVDTDRLNDRRSFSWNQNPIYVEPGQTITFLDWYTTNITTGISVALSGEDKPDVVHTESSSGFVVKPSARPAQSVTATASPSHNPITALIKSTVYIVRRWVAEWKGYDPDIYASEGKKVYVVDYTGGYGSSKTVQPTVDYWQNPGGSPIRTHGQVEPGYNGNTLWTYSVPSGMTQSYSGSQDRVTYTVPKTVRPGDYPIYATVKADGYADEAFIRVADTRFLYWFATTGDNTSGAVSTSLDISMGARLDLSHPTMAAMPRFVFGDETGNSGSPLNGARTYFTYSGNSAGQMYPYLYGQSIRNNFQSTLSSQLVIDVPPALTFSSGPSFTVNAVGSGASSMPVGRITGTLASLPATDGPHTITVYLADNPDVSIDLNLTFNSSGPEVTYTETLILEPATAAVNVGGTVNMTSVKLRTVTYHDGEQYSDVITDLAMSDVTWSSSNNGIATVSNGIVTGVAPGTARITASYNAPHGTTVSDYCDVTVSSVTTYEETLVLTPTTASIAEGNQRQFTSLKLVTKTFVDGQLTNTTETALSFSAFGLTWTSDHTNIATVQNGTVTGIHAGQARITVRYNAPHGGTPEAYCDITVYTPDGVTIDTGWDNGGSTILD